MHEALIYTSRQGPFKKEITAFEIKSREHYRELFPLVDKNSGEPVTWVRGTFEDGKLKRRSHFRTLTGRRHEDFFDFNRYKRHREKSVESDEHKEAKKVLIGALNKRLYSDKTMFWAFKDEDISSLYFKGNILYGATKIKNEFCIDTAFKKQFYLDIAVLGDGIENAPLALFGIEIEKSSKFNGLKTILCKTLGFPFISVDISGMSLFEINEEWAEKTLSLTTSDDKKGFRKNFVYLPPILYPFYVRNDIGLELGEKHQYIIFVSDNEIYTLRDKIKKTRDSLGISKSVIDIAIVNGKQSPEALHQVEIAGNIIGNEWELLNNQQYLRVSLPRPLRKFDLPRLQKFYLLMANCLLSANTLVGYKYITGKTSSQPNPNDDFWTVYKVFKEQRKPAIPHRFLPKLLSVPLVEIAEKLGLR